MLLATRDYSCYLNPNCIVFNFFHRPILVGIKLNAKTSKRKERNKENKNVLHNTIRYLCLCNSVDDMTQPNGVSVL